MPPIVIDIFTFLGHLVSALGLLVFGFAAARFILDQFPKSNTWQVQAALALALFATLIGLAKFTTPGSAGAFALGAGIAFFASGGKKKDEDEGKK